MPGGAASAATVLDGYPMAKRGEAGRALSAAYMSSLIGGIFGAVLLGVTIPILRPIMLYLGSPELLAFAVFGISMVAILSGNAPLRGLTAGCVGIMLSMIGSDPQTGTLRWTFDRLYLWDGMPLVPIAARPLRAAGAVRPADHAHRRSRQASRSTNVYKGHGRA